MFTKRNQSLPRILCISFILVGGFACATTQTPSQNDPEELTTQAAPSGDYSESPNIKTAAERPRGEAAGESHPTSGDRMAFDEARFRREREAETSEAATRKSIEVYDRGHEAICRYYPPVETCALSQYAWRRAETEHGEKLVASVPRARQFELRDDLVCGRPVGKARECLLFAPWVKVKFSFSDEEMTLELYVESSAQKKLLQEQLSRALRAP